MKFLALVLVTLSFAARAGVKELYLPVLECGRHEFQDVTVTFDDSPDARKDLTVGKLCEKLALKLLRKTHVSEISRFVTDELAPRQLDPLMPRANDFFRLVLFKGNIIHRTKFDFSEDDLAAILQRLEEKSKLRISSFDPSSKQMLTIAYHRGGTAFFNRFKMHRHACEQINTLVHEYMHFVGYSHGDNSPVGKENSVPYYFGNRAQELCEAGVI